VRSLFRRRSAEFKAKSRFVVEVYVPGLTHAEHADLARRIWETYQTWSSDHWDGRWQMVNTEAMVSYEERGSA
jgi:hypothetical protein